MLADLEHVEEVDHMEEFHDLAGLTDDEVEYHPPAARPV